jgi:hypothetical protein
VTTVVPITQLGTRLPEHGRIRLGVKTAKAMKSIDTFRFTSGDRAAIETLASLYGGTAKPWADPKANPPTQYEVVSEASEIRVLLPPDALSVWYEQWSGGGVTRRCDGVTCQVPLSGPDAAMGEVPCLCVAQNAMACRPYTRLNVILPEVRFGGAWRLETKGWNAAHEMPTMERMIQQLQAFGIVEGRLVLERRQSQGGKRKFVVPKLLIDTSPLDMLAGMAAVGSLAGPESTPALGPGGEPADEPAVMTPPENRQLTEPVEIEDVSWFEDPDDEPVDAELVPEEPTAPPVPPVTERARRRAKDPQQTKLVLVVAEVWSRLQNEGHATGLTEDELRHALAWAASGQRTDSSAQLTSDEKSKVIDNVHRVLDGELALVSLAHPVSQYRRRPM